MDQENQGRWRRWAIGIPGILVLGTLGSGIWDRLGDPLYVLCRDALLNFVTLGLTTLKDSLYANVSLGLHEDASVRTYFAGGFLVLYVITAVLFFYYVDQVQPRRISEKRVVSMRRLLHRRVIQVVLCMALFLLVVHVFGGIKLNYTNRAIAHYKQLHSLVRPYISDSESFMFDSRFSQIRYATDYVSLVDELKTTAASHNLRVPTFEPW